jgi:hypothetical protein
MGVAGCGLGGLMESAWIITARGFMNKPYTDRRPGQDTRCGSKKTERKTNPDRR